MLGERSGGPLDRPRKIGLFGGTSDLNVDGCINMDIRNICPNSEWLLSWPLSH